ncbi:MAG: hypothetical protein JXB07_18235 [Anaerolineae bacterium]|nr:hypothetical protein [Anaerolineae bacterium]
MKRGNYTTVMGVGGWGLGDGDWGIGVALRSSTPFYASKRRDRDSVPSVTIQLLVPAAWQF